MTKVWRKRFSLMKATSKGEILYLSTIPNNIQGRGSNTPHDEGNNDRREIKIMQDLLQIVPYNPVIILQQVNLKGNYTLLGFGMMGVVDNFLGHKGILRSASPNDKISLKRVDNIILIRPKTLHKNFSDDFICHITQANGPEVLELLGIIYLGNKNNKIFY